MDISESRFQAEQLRRLKEQQEDQVFGVSKERRKARCKIGQIDNEMYVGGFQITQTLTDHC